MRHHHQQVIDLFKEHFKENNFIGVEIGTAEGWLTKSLLLELPNLQLIYTIDPYKHDPTSEFEARLPIEIHEIRKNEAKKNLEVWGERAKLIVDTSDNAISQIPDNVDFVWVDGDHSNNQVKKDIINYYPKVKINGIFGGHDYQRVIPIFREMIENIIYLGDDWTWWIIKDNRVLKNV